MGIRDNVHEDEVNYKDFFLKNCPKSKAISPLTFFFKKLFLILKYNSKAASVVVLLKKSFLKLLEYSQESTLVGLSF